MEREKKVKRKRNGEMMMTFLTIYSIYKYGMSNGKARFTAALMFCNVLAFFRKPTFIIDSILPPIDHVSFNSYGFLKTKKQKHFYLSALYHFGENHLMYDMLKLLGNGIELEPLMGGLNYATMFATLLIISQTIKFVWRYLVLLLGGKWVYKKDEKLVGSTSVTFALDYIRNKISDQYDQRYNFFGYNLFPRKLSPWIDLILARKIGAGDILDNLGGIFTGYLYLKFINPYYYYYNNNKRNQNQNQNQNQNNPISKYLIRTANSNKYHHHQEEDDQLLELEFKRLDRLWQEIEFEQETSCLIRSLGNNHQQQQKQEQMELDNNNYYSEWDIMIQENRSEYGGNYIRRPKFKPQLSDIESGDEDESIEEEEEEERDEGEYDKAGSEEEVAGIGTGTGESHRK